jgi:tripartite-type tricarboxylate transporter receptor subunit TctC
LILRSLAAAWLFACTAAGAQGYVTLLIAFPPGGSSDVLARSLAEALSKELDQKVVVENKPGGNGALAAIALTSAPANGKTLWLSTSGAVSINPELYPQLSYDLNAMKPVSLVANMREVLVVNAVNPARDAREFIRAAAAGSKPLALASSGIGSMPHMAIALLTDATKVPFTHIPEKGIAPAINDLMGGHVDGTFADLSAVLPFIRSGKLRALGVTAPARHPLLPDVPTFDELGIKGMRLNNWSAVYVAKATGDETVRALSGAIRRAIEQPDLRARLGELGVELQASDPQQLNDLSQADRAQWKRIIQAYGIKPE